VNCLARAKSEKALAEREAAELAGAQKPRMLAAVAAPAAAAPGVMDDAVLEGVPVDPATARKLARDAAWRDQRWRW
jgi:hypothetical protein